MMRIAETFDTSDSAISCLGSQGLSQREHLLIKPLLHRAFLTVIVLTMLCTKIKKALMDRWFPMAQLDHHACRIQRANMRPCRNMPGTSPLQPGMVS